MLPVKGAKCACCKVIAVKMVLDFCEGTFGGRFPRRNPGYVPGKSGTKIWKLLLCDTKYAG